MSVKQKETRYTPVEVFEGLRKEVMSLFDQMEELAAFVLIFSFLGILMLAVAGLTDFAHRRLLALVGLVFVGANAWLMATAAMKARRKVRRLLADPRPFQRLAELMVSLITLTICLQEIALSLFRYTHKNSGVFLKNLHALRFIPGVDYIANMGPEQIHVLSKLLVDVTKGWKTVFEMIQQEAEQTAPIDLAGHQKTMHKMQSVLTPVNAIFTQLMVEVETLLNQPGDEDSEAYVQQIIEQLEELHGTLSKLPDSLLALES